MKMKNVRPRKSLQTIIHFSTPIYSSFFLYPISSAFSTSVKASFVCVTQVRLQFFTCVLFWMCIVQLWSGGEGVTKTCLHKLRSRGCPWASAYGSHAGKDVHIPHPTRWRDAAAVLKALALERESRALNGYKEWPEYIFQASVQYQKWCCRRLDLWKGKVLYTEKLVRFCFCCLHKEEMETSA